jgi:hypothetical protein
MKKIILTILVILSISMTGCKPNVISTQEFEVISRQNIKDFTGSNYDELYIVVHKDTGKKFVIFKGYRKGGIAPLD